MEAPFVFVSIAGPYSSIVQLLPYFQLTFSLTIQPQKASSATSPAKGHTLGVMLEKPENIHENHLNEYLWRMQSVLCGAAYSGA
jgi:hypothetical protein